MNLKKICWCWRGHSKLSAGLQASVFRGEHDVKWITVIIQQ